MEKNILESNLSKKKLTRNYFQMMKDKLLSGMNV